jgi:excisionase family DNA binding protein
MHAHPQPARRDQAEHNAPTSAEPLPDFLPLGEACRVARVSRSELYRKAGAGQIRFVKLGKRVRVDMRSVRLMLERLPEARLRPPKPQTTSKSP